MNMFSKQEFGSANLLHNGQTLKQYRDAIIERTRATGHYNGLTELALRDGDLDTADTQAATLNYGLGNWYLVKGDATKARNCLPPAAF